MKAITYLQLPGGIVRAPERIREGPHEGCWMVYGQEVWDKTPGLFFEFTACAMGSPVRKPSGLIKFLPPEWVPPEWMDVDGAQRPPTPEAKAAPVVPALSSHGEPVLMLDERSHRVRWKGVEFHPRSVPYFEFLLALARSPEVAVPPHQLGGKKVANLARHRLVKGLEKAGAVAAEVEAALRVTATGYVLAVPAAAVRVLPKSSAPDLTRREYASRP